MTETQPLEEQTDNPRLAPPKTVAERRRDAGHNLWETTNLLAVFALCLRCIISLQPYSGCGRPPMYGDYEAQRHWQEITFQLPIDRWYENGTDNDLQYWGLDYPPLTAYHSWAVGWLANRLNASYVRLHESRGIQSDAHKTFMRGTVLMADVLLYLPVMWLMAWTCWRIGKQRKPAAAAGVPDYGMRLFHLAVLWLFPGQMLIDNGHFQYNNISLGLAALAVAALLHGRLLAGCVAFALALNYKQMELYHALPIFVFLLRRCVPERTRSWGEYWARFAVRLAAKGAVVVAVFGALWWPWLSRSLAASLQVVHRVFPVARGVFEDKVANVWCVVNVAIPLK